MAHLLAIVIPAYKIDFFEQTLQSLSVQTCKDFTVYIGDDCSTSDLYSIVEKFKGTLNIVYQRFTNNLGGCDLVAHWERCILLTQGEPWICLFSDDDIMGVKCVELFYNEIDNSTQKYDLYHFNVKVINSNGNIVKHPRNYPNIIESWLYYKKKLTAKLDSFVVEYIFSRKKYEDNGFVRFPMAWGSDVATWVRMGNENGIKTIDGEHIYWRQSNSNITPNHRQDVVVKKMNTEIEMLKWADDFFHTFNCHLFNKYAFFRSLFFYSLFVNWKQACCIIRNAKNHTILNGVESLCMRLIYPLIKLTKYCKSILFK